MAITSPWSNRQTEGQITKLKLVKRQMYGRGKLDLLEASLIGSMCTGQHQNCARANLAHRLTIRTLSFEGNAPRSECLTSKWICLMRTMAIWSDMEMIRYNIDIDHNYIENYDKMVKL